MNDNFVICPYDRNHIIDKMKLPYHLVKCEKNYPNIILEKCPYNYTHRFPAEEMPDHILSCSARPEEFELESIQKKEVKPEFEHSVHTINPQESSLVSNSNEISKNGFNHQKCIRPPVPCPRVLSVCGLKVNVQY
ncbi:hypothetical protein R5R35_013050 [Gryllus longicercus]|uniref:CHHC U11-48K-type domain-containing protein n=1 Tax=Gryllus longicercus TaxID=2509291 RepID=A0AAN9VF10_9ORTH